ncbi:hypothetical protein NPX13_g7953 [Xylaria arbuscula]|uniref:Heterokaryon incompatibility domain-containing protein n=1 Tax=Xylaria arbuscula TaxID=114810 RepID=A0A9W8TIS7_9PEZI|nr:hypothetical protein NPX13_g7953 [Xylaria arbuscula]
MANSNTSTTELVAASPAPPATRLPSTTWQSGQNLATTDFQYEALPDPETYFRLLKINSIPHDSAWLPKVTRLLDFRAKREPAEAAAGQFVECDLTTWPIDSAPNYHAISYTWGEEQSPSRIKVGGKYMQVRRNCEYMLQQVFKHCGSETYIWVDAICINQNDNTEKNHQVYMMGSIYSRADRVLACIGNHDGDSQFLFRTLRREEKRLEEIGRASAINHEDYPLELMKLCSQRKPHQARINLRDPSRLSRAYKAIFQRLYFSRVWTVQELWVANSVVVLCGTTTAVSELSRFSSFGPLDISAYTIFGQTCTGENKRLRLVEAMRRIRDLQCDDIRDKLYGQITVVDWSSLGIDPIRPDYSIRIFDLAFDILYWTSLNNELDVNTAFYILAGFLAHPRDSQLQEFRDDFNTVVERRRYEYSPGSHIQETIVESCSIWRFRSPPEDSYYSILDENRASDIMDIAKMLPQPQYRRISSDNCALDAVVPHSVQSGDWIVTGGVSSREIVLREESNGKFHVVCNAWCSVGTKTTLFNASTRFMLFFDIEDLIVFISPTEPWSQPHSLELDCTPENLSNYFSIPICSAPGSSFAVKAREIETSNPV